MKAFLIFGGLFMIVFGSMVPLSRVIKEYETQKNGELVSATITYIPKCIGTKTNHFIKFTYAGEEFDKKVGCSFADDHKVGELIKLKHIEGTDIFLFENETKEGDFIAAGLLGVFGISFIFIGAKRK